MKEHHAGSDSPVQNGIEDDTPHTVPGSLQGGATSSEDVGSEYSSDDFSQEPKTMAATDLFPIFEKYGPIQDLVVIRDKHTGQYRGCAFVTYLSNES